MKGAGFCSLYREFHYIAIRNNEVCLYQQKSEVPLY